MREFKRTILIVDDNELNRDILSDLLSDEYDVLEADNGKTALDLLKATEKLVSAVFLDIQMPVMDGFTFLLTVKEEPNLSQIPIIVMTASDDVETEIKCLSEGAMDFVTKPFHPDIVRARLKNVIHLRESVSALSVTEYDDQTGLYAKSAFLHHVDTVRQHQLGSRFDMIAIKVSDFEKLITKYGMSKPMSLLKQIGNILRMPKNRSAVSAHFGMGVFLAVVNIDECGVTTKETLQNFIKDFDANPVIHGTDIKFAVYEHLESNASTHTLCERVFCVLDRLKNQYGVTVGYYSPEIQKEIDLLAQVKSDMENGLAEKQFAVFYQPRFSISEGNDHIAGAEALIRWAHPTLGFLSPGMFIPLFEQTGFITNVDFYMIESVCADLRMWIDNGTPVYPVSINLSRVDFALSDLDDRITAIVDKYEIAHSLIHFEVTESAYSSRDDLIEAIIKKLHNKGFIFELDDFGSGYSSLASLQYFDIDIVKMDLSLIRNDDQNSKKNVLVFAHKLMNTMGIKTVQEGVETEKELERVRALGCDCVQGYYFSKPLCKNDYAEFCIKNSTGEK